MEISSALESSASLPFKGSPGAAGYDLKVLRNGKVLPKSVANFETGLSIAIPPGYVGIVKSRSGLSFKSSIEVGAGVIDSDYRGSIKVRLYNHGVKTVSFKAGDRIAQLLILKCEAPTFIPVDVLPSSDRGTSGFGSTGI